MEGRTTPAAPRTVAVVGSGVAGLTAAYVASRTAEVTLYEADDRLGGHADTHQVTDRRPDGTEQVLGIDTGFIVHNPRTYPVLLRMFAELGVATQPSEMSMSIRDDQTGLEWAGALGRRGLFPTRENLSRPRYLAMLAEIPRFHRQAKAVVARARTPSGPSVVEDVTLRQFLRQGRFSAYFVRHFMEPLVAAVWSCDPEVALDYPARYLFTFLEHHGMLGIFGSPQWRTVTGGSRAYVEKVGARLQHVRLGAKVTSVLETADGVEVTDGNGDVSTYDAVVVATHPSHALAMLAEPTALQREVLAAMPYSANTALLHTDASLLPVATAARASWNFRRPLDADARPGEVMVTYDLTRLQRLPTDTAYLVTLGGEHVVDPTTVIARREYEHPLYNPESVAAQARLPEVSGDRVAFAGAYHGWGFHEDGARSGLAAAERVGLTWPVAEQAPGAAAARERRELTGVFETTVRHTRRRPWRRAFTHRTRTWVVDLDDLPDHGLLGRFEARDHLGDPERTIRENLEAFLDREGAVPEDGLRGGQVLMTANARALGYVFNPISVFWCFDAAGDLAATVVEVHNTYGDRHAYVVHPDAQGRARTEKAMYVSPFHGTDGWYDLAVPVPDERLHVAVTLSTDDGARFSASLDGRRLPDDDRRAALKAAPAALRGSVLIHAHGIWLWLRRLPIRPRPSHHQEGVR
ncbi:Putative flavin-containing monoamine oxidase AofH [Nocardioides aquaticus]|uniref:Flavin-containing monoamine oxidase AofH n=1 Tax=Nocardioides aquaticus TaxID=160826 RepID=A0ABX8EN12_9ACTN|nr:FAD-dependent oxidoreductase [Nocardioides aquaticus]QVT81914.1 Putative flavin-containing monoamine oxidase AofH [Nocardioides aquaticus]